MTCRELTDEQWKRLESLLPPIPRMGRPPKERRQVFNGIWWRTPPGTSWPSRSPEDSAETRRSSSRLWDGSPLPGPASDARAPGRRM
ncbi:transposase [Streptomyces sp. x-19]|uniref:transposase n=1 Tax=Streptomyces sp. x-19 TaxID=2789280 RepID=UPI00397FFFB7